MGRLKRVIAMTAGALALAGCSHAHIGEDATGPNPKPPPGYRVACRSYPMPFNAYFTYCSPSQATEERVVVRAKG